VRVRVRVRVRVHVFVCVFVCGSMALFQKRPGNLTKALSKRARMS